ncbi:polysaccharide deacetylase family protein [Thalassorhabdus alkalitolerans]|uniref:Polysaccharide deacetylase family protein n=1 Tax=Thalassorhabdus alkalitolerans TaxID=2282697 RepID=A0ABW0YKT8_9BACI
MKKYIGIFALALTVTACTETETDVEEVEEEMPEENNIEETDDETADIEETEEGGGVDEDPGSEALNEEEDQGDAEAAEHEGSYTVNQNDWSLEPVNDADEQVVLLTIDDAPDNHGVEMAEILYELDAPAIFFVNGHFLQSEEGEEQLEAIYDMGFAIGNHTMNHQKLDDVSEEEQTEEIVELNDLIEDIIGERPEYFRAPHGVNTDHAREVVEEENMILMNWTYGYDWEADYTEPEPLAEIMVETELLRDGANLLMHDREWTMEALEDIVLGLEEKGYGFVHPDQIEE